MKNLTLICLLALSACAQSQEKVKVRTGAPVSTLNASQAYFAEGCFWHTEMVFQSLEGVKDAVSGYSGGSTVSPSYEQVCSGKTGHAETVRVVYDPFKISFEQLARAFFESHDPTTLNRQGNDKGSEYRSIAFYRTEDEKKVLEKLRSEYQKKFASNIVTELKPFTAFYEAEEYHQEFIRKNPGNGYINNVSIPELNEFKKKYKGKLKE